MDVTKIIKAKIGHSNYVVADPIMKEDYGLYLLIEGIDLPQSYEVDFSNELRDGTSVTMIGDENGVRIPEQFIEPGRNVYAFYYHVGSDFGRTLYTIRIPNRARPERTDEQPTPVQQSTIDQAIAALNVAVTKTAQDVLDADQSAQEAGQSAEQAHEASIDAQNFAEQAEQSASAAATSASQANASASSASQSASQSAQIKTAIEGMVSDARASAAASAQSASAASASTSSAATSAQTATIKAAEAAASAASVGEAAQTATAKAAEASASSTSASGSASAAATSASTASTKAAEASASATAAETAQTAAETAQGKAEDAQEAAETAAQNIEASAAQIATNTSDIADVKRDLNDKAPVVIETVSGSIASFADGADDMPMKSLVVNIEPVQSGSGDPSPDNVRPISGWTGCEVNVTGVNVWDEEWEVGSYYSNKDTVRKDNTDTTHIRSKNPIEVKPNFTYYMNSANKNVHLIVADAEGNVLYRTISLNNGTFTTPTNGAFVYFNMAAAYGTTYNNDISINYPSTDHDYHENHVKSYPISWQSEAGTVYGGTLDVVSGLLTVDRAIVTLNSELSYSIGIGAERNRVTWNGYEFLGKLNGTFVSDKLTTVANASGGYGSADWQIYGSIVAPRVWITVPSNIASVSDVTAYFAENPVQVVYELATPQTYQLDPTEVKSILGLNNVWADCGDCEVEYRADTKLYIERLTAPDSADMIADANITSGQYFMVGNNLYKATANIANGGQITVGTNATRVSLAQALNEINA